GTTVVGTVLVMAASYVSGIVVIGFIAVVPLTVLFQMALYERLSAREVPEPAQACEPPSARGVAWTDDRRPPHRPERQVPPARGGPSLGAGRTHRDRRLRRARAGPRARAHLPDHGSRAVERARR